MSVVLDKHQKEASDFIMEHKKAALFMEVGTGKTYTAIDVYKRSDIKNCLILTTAKLVNTKQWENEIIKYLGHMPKNITLISHSKFSRNVKAYSQLTYEMVIVDEAHKVKSNETTKISKAINRLSKKAKYVIPMTGTPSGNDYIDIFNIFKNCDIEMWHGWTQARFIKKYYHYKEIDYLGRGFKTTVATSILRDASAAIWYLVREKAIIVKSDDVYNLKKPKTLFIYCDNAQDNDTYRKLKNKIISYEDYEDTMLAVQSAMYLRQAANGFIYRKKDKSVKVLNTIKIDKFKETIPIVLNKVGKTVVVYWFKYDLKQIWEVFGELKISATACPNEFRKGNAEVLMLHASTAEGLNLQDISRSIYFYSFDHSYINHAQMKGRIWRRGQRKKCFYFVLLARKTIDDKLWKSIKLKRTKDQYLKSVMRGGDG